MDRLRARPPLAPDQAVTYACEPLARYTEANARLTVQRRNVKDGQLTNMAVGCGDHWHVIEVISTEQSGRPS